MREITLKLSGGTFTLSADSGGGTISSNLHYGSLQEFLEGEEPGDPLDDQFVFGRYEGTIDALESLILGAQQAGIDVQGTKFKTAVQTTLDAIGNEF